MEKMGQIEVICGPMFAGKTEELIRRANRLEYAKKKYLVFKPTIDDRYSTTEIVSHSNYRKNSICVKSSSEILGFITDDIKAVIIDEVQFFDENVINVAEWLADKGLRVICGGLDCDFKGNPFKIVAELLARAESVVKLNAICNVCGQPATRTQRIIDGHPAYEDDPIILVGATEAYEPRCRKCHMVLKRDK
jgi:thymidine kinase